MIRDLSIGGAFVQTSSLQPIGTHLIVRLPLPDSHGGLQWIEGRVVRVVDLYGEGGRTTTGMGVEFRLNDAQREGLAQLIGGIVEVKHLGSAPRSTLPPGTEFVGDDISAESAGEPTPRRLMLVARPSMHGASAPASPEQPVRTSTPPLGGSIPPFPAPASAPAAPAPSTATPKPTPHQPMVPPVAPAPLRPKLPTEDIMRAPTLPQRLGSASPAATIPRPPTPTPSGLRASTPAPPPASGPAGGHRSRPSSIPPARSSRPPPAVPGRIQTIPQAARPSVAPRETPAGPSVFAPLPPVPSAFEDVTLRLDLMRGGQVRAVRVPLAVVREGRLSPCGSTLHVRVYCREPARSYQLDIKADFGPEAPRSARLTVFSGDSPVGPAVTLVSGGEYREPELPLDLECPSEQLVFRIALNPASGAALELVGVARLGQVGEGEVRRETQSSRLRAARAALKTDLADALLHAPVPALAVLGRLIEAAELGEKMELLRRLFERQLDIRLVEAAVRDIEVTARMEKGFTDVEFAALSLSDPVDASIVLFHPRSPTYLLAVCFVLCLEQNLAPANEREGQWWRQLAKAGAVALWRRDRSALEELQGTMRASEDPVKVVLLEKLTKWAARRETTLPPEPKDPFEDRLARIRGESPDAAFAAALEALIFVGYLSVTRDLGPGSV